MDMYIYINPSMNMQRSDEERMPERWDVGDKVKQTTWGCRLWVGRGTSVGIPITPPSVIKSTRKLINVGTVLDVSLPFAEFLLG